VVVDRSLTPSHNKVVVARVGQDLLLKRMQVRQRKVFLVADPPEFPAIELSPQDEIWGLVTYCIQHV
jgi:DNA polymerase V